MPLPDRSSCRAGALVVGAALVLAACTTDVVAELPASTAPVVVTTGAPPTSTGPATSVAPTSSPPTTAPPTTSPASTTTTAPPTTSTTSTTSPAVTHPPTTVEDERGPVRFDATSAAFASLSSGNAAATLSVWRDGLPALQLAAGTERGGDPVTTTTPMVVASVSKLITALTIARLAELDVLDVGAPVPWGDLGFAVHPEWLDVTVRELLDHTSGMPTAQRSWLDEPGSCAVPLSVLLGAPPTEDRGTWRYSNGGYCALGLLIEATTGERYDVAGRWLVFDPVGATGPRLTIDGSLPGDAPHRADISRFDRLGAAGSWLAGSDHIASVLSATTRSDRNTLRWPGIFLDEYGWGHTGTLDGAKACAWVLEDGRTTVAAVVSGQRPSSGGGVCDVVLPALGADLGLTGIDGLPLGEPDRSPP